jgi:hypothetical protein
MELVEKHPNASNFHATWSLSSFRWTETISHVRLSQSMVFVVPKVP